MKGDRTPLAQSQCQNLRPPTHNTRSRPLACSLPSLLAPSTPALTHAAPAQLHSHQPFIPTSPLQCPPQHAGNKTSSSSNTAPPLSPCAAADHLPPRHGIDGPDGTGDARLCVRMPRTSSPEHDHGQWRGRVPTRIEGYGQRRGGGR